MSKGNHIVRFIHILVEIRTRVPVWVFLCGNCKIMMRVCAYHLMILGSSYFFQFLWYFCYRFPFSRTFEFRFFFCSLVGYATNFHVAFVHKKCKEEKCDISLEFFSLINCYSSYFKCSHWPKNNDMVIIMASNGYGEKKQRNEKDCMFFIWKEKLNPPSIGICLIIFYVDVWQ